jgi:hypothetical protein
MILNEVVKSDEVAKLVGILSHFVYWAVFGSFNELAIDHYHLRALLITLL